MLHDDATASTAALTDEESLEDETEWEEYEYSIPTPKSQYDKRDDRIPLASILIRAINDIPSLRPLRILFDSGGTATMIHERALPPGCTPTLMKKPVTSQTIEGNFTSKTYVRLKDMVLPDFDRQKRIDSHTACVFKGNSRYDLIVGRDFLHKIGMKLDFDLKLMQWMGQSVAMRKTVQEEPEACIQDQVDYIIETYATEMAGAKYEQVSPAEVAANRTGQPQTNLPS